MSTRSSATRKARRVIFFAIHEGSRLASWQTLLPFELYSNAGTPGEATAVLVRDPGRNVWYFHAVVDEDGLRPGRPNA